jgi:hypothetical protein
MTNSEFQCPIYTTCTNQRCELVDFIKTQSQTGGKGSKEDVEENKSSKGPWWDNNRWEKNRDRALAMSDCGRNDYKNQEVRRLAQEKQDSGQLV